MKRSLCLLIGKGPNYNGSNYLQLTSPTENYRALDVFIMNHFLNSYDVREYYINMISPFLENKKYLLNPTSKYRGSIVIIETGYNRAPQKIKVLYSDVKQRLQEVLECIPFIREYADDNPNLFCGHIRDALWQREGQNYPLSEIKKMLYSWKKEILKNSSKVTDNLRDLLKAYEKWVEEYNKTVSKEEKIKIFQYEVPESQIKKLQINRIRTRAS